MFGVWECAEMKRADAILTADIELRSHTPICRTDNHWLAQERKITWLRQLQKEHGCPVIDAGDLFDKKYKTHPSHHLLAWAANNLPEQFYTVAGNHDLPGKSIENYSNSAMAVLESGKKLCALNGWLQTSRETNFSLYGYPWGVELKETRDIKRKLKELKIPKRTPLVAVVHAMIYKKDLPFPGCEGYSAQQVLDRLPSFNLIVTGHHHATFAHRDGDRMLINPGSLMRNDADQIDHEPCVFLWYAKSKRFKRVYIPIEQGVISREHIEIKNARETRLDAFVEKLGKQTVDGVNFHKNLESMLNKNKVRKDIADKVWQYYEGKILN